MKPHLNRRDFLKTTAVSVSLSSLPLQAAGSIARRTLGKTGAQVSILAFGGGSRFLAYEEEAGLLALNEAIDSGINYLDTAQAYGEGKSEERYGKVLKTRRKEVFLATKVQDRTYDGALRAVEASLKRLQTDHVDLLHIHSLNDLDDLAAIEKGVLKALYKLRDDKSTRFIGMTCHSQAEALKTAIQRHDLDCVQMALNPATNSGYATGFERTALPAAKAKNLGVLAMKVMGQEKLVGQGPGRTSGAQLLRYALNLPVAACVVGMPKIEMLRENIQVARAFKPLPAGEIEQIRSSVSASAAAFDHYMLNHHDDGLA
ncbi:MAG: aldo/keto reductase [Acidobacteria bacterium]|nr:MAG: aldo/keto reductase [Acidobacteriota bacterium]